MTAITPIAALAEHSVLSLTRRDLLELEQQLCVDLSRVLGFGAHALYFPTDNSPQAPVWLPEEQKLLLPLRQAPMRPHEEKRSAQPGALLGVLLLRNPQAEQIERLLPQLPGLVELCLDKLALIKTSRLDVATGLFSRQVLLSSISREVEAMRQAFAPTSLSASSSDAESSRGSHPALSLIMLRMPGISKLARQHGYPLGDALVEKLACALLENIPVEAMPARTGDLEFSILLPASRQNTHTLAHDLAHTLSSVGLKHPVTNKELQVPVYAGYIVFPHDTDGHSGRRSALDQASLLLDKASLTAQRAAEQEHFGVLGFGNILQESGRIDQVLPLSRVQVDLGRALGAQEGQRFSVWSLSYAVQGLAGHTNSPDRDDARQPLYKGEIVLVDVKENSSMAEVLILGDPAWHLEPGDTLRLMREEAHYSSGNAEARPDPLTGLFRHGDFLAQWAEQSQHSKEFTLALLRLEIPQLSAGTRTEHLVAEHMALVRHIFGESCLAGRHGLNSVLLFHPNLGPREALNLYMQLMEDLEKKGNITAAAGLACYPFLNFRPADMLECSRKALEYSMLLPKPHVGVFDSLALTISADKHYSQGDMFGAVEEYGQALLADNKNVLAWNSLGVCLAGLGRQAEAHRHFLHALECSVTDQTTHYNLGTSCANMGEMENAVKHFELCLELAPDHFFARIRLGQLAEGKGKLDEAQAHFSKVLHAGSSLPYRHLARLELKEGKPDKAREHLYQALQRDPQDALALQMMARLYLDGGEDAELAEALARQSLALMPRKATWKELARALTAQGKTEEAEKAMRQMEVF